MFWLVDAVAAVVVGPEREYVVKKSGWVIALQMLPVMSLRWLEARSNVKYCCSPSPGLFWLVGRLID